MNMFLVSLGNKYHKALNRRITCCGSTWSIWHSTFCTSCLSWYCLSDKLMRKCNAMWLVTEMDAPPLQSWAASGFAMLTVRWRWTWKTIPSMMVLCSVRDDERALVCTKIEDARVAWIYMSFMQCLSFLVAEMKQCYIRRPQWHPSEAMFLGDWIVAHTNFGALEGIFGFLGLYYLPLMIDMN